MSDTPRTDAGACHVSVDRAGCILLWHSETGGYVERKVSAQLERENAELHNELMALKYQIQEKCSCGGTDCEGQRDNAALHEGNRVLEWKEKYEDLEKDIRFIGKQIPVNTGGTFENDPLDAILDAAVRALNDRKPERVNQLNSFIDAVITSWKEEKKTMELSHQETLDSLQYTVERTKVFEALAEMIYKSGYDNIDGIKKIYEAVREKYPVGTYFPPCKKE
jgi:hypothetical protein